MEDDYILETHKLVKEFKGFIAVNDVSLKVKRGHIHALIGPNGAGKTTVFNLITGFLRPDDGGVTFKGKHITDKEFADYLKQIEGISAQLANFKRYLMKTDFKKKL